MIPFPLHLELLQPQPRPTTSIERELAAIHARAARRPKRQPLLNRLALRRLFGGFPVASTGEITIRRATDADRAALERLAQIDQLPLPRGATLVAEVDRRVVAGIALDTAEPIADPFRARRDVVQLLQVRAAQLAA